MPTIQPVPLGQAGAPEALNMPWEYEQYIAQTQRLVQLLGMQYEDACNGFNRFQAKAVEALAIADRVIASRQSDPQAAKVLAERRANFVGNFNAMQQKMLEGLTTLEKVKADVAEGLHHLLGMAQGRNAPQAAATPQQPQAVQGPQPNTVEASAPPAFVSQVAEVVEANGQRTVFENGQPVLVIEPQAGAVQNGTVVAEGGVIQNGTIVS